MYTQTVSYASESHPQRTRVSVRTTTQKNIQHKIHSHYIFTLCTVCKKSMVCVDTDLMLVLCAALTAGVVLAFIVIGFLACSRSAPSPPNTKMQRPLLSRRSAHPPPLPPLTDVDKAKPLHSGYYSA